MGKQTALPYGNNGITIAGSAIMIDSKIYLSSYIRLVLLTVFILSISTFSQAGGTDDKINIEEVINVLNQDDMYLITNTINKLNRNAENLSFIYDLWNLKRDKYVSLPWKKIESDLVRLEIADVLLQSHRHCYIEIDKKEVHSFVRSKIYDRDIGVRDHAILKLGLAGDEEDIPTLIDIIKEEIPGISGGAALSLVFIHSDNAMDALKNVRDSISSSEIKSFIDETLTKYDKFPKINYSSNCDSEGTDPAFRRTIRGQSLKYPHKPIPQPQTHYKTYLMLKTLPLHTILIT